MDIIYRVFYRTGKVWNWHLKIDFNNFNRAMSIARIYMKDGYDVRIFKFVPQQVFDSMCDGKKIS